MSKSSADRRRRSRGFTLIELLVVLVVFGLLLALLAGGVRFAGRAWQTQERQLDRQDDLGAVQGMLRRLIAGGVQFRGDATSLSFIGSMPGVLGEPGLFEITLKTSQDRLVLTWRQHGEARPPPALTETELLRRVAGLSLAYFVSDPAGRSGGWRSTAQDQQRAPRLIKIVVQFDDAAGRRWPPLIVAPMIELAGGG